MLHDLLMVSPSCRGSPAEMHPPPRDPDAVRSRLDRAYSTLYKRQGVEAGPLIVAFACQCELDTVAYNGPHLDTANPQTLLLAAAWVIGTDNVLARWVTAADANYVGATHEDTARLPPATDAAQQASAAAALKQANYHRVAAASIAGCAAGFGIGRSSAAHGLDGKPTTSSGKLLIELKRLLAHIGKTKLAIRGLLSAQHERTKRLHRIRAATVGAAPLVRLAPRDDLDTQDHLSMFEAHLVMHRDVLKAHEKAVEDQERRASMAATSFSARQATWFKWIQSMATVASPGSQNDGTGGGGGGGDARAPRRAAGIKTSAQPASQAAVAGIASARDSLEQTVGKLSSHLQLAMQVRVLAGATGYRDNPAAMNATDRTALIDKLALVKEAVYDDCIGSIDAQPRFTAQEVGVAAHGISTPAALQQQRHARTPTLGSSQLRFLFKTPAKKKRGVGGGGGARSNVSAAAALRGAAAATAGDYPTMCTAREEGRRLEGVCAKASEELATLAKVADDRLQLLLSKLPRAVLLR